MRIIGKTVERQSVLFKGDLGAGLLRHAKCITAALYWQSNESGRWEVESNGSCFFVDFEGAKFLVTAAHVIDGYTKRVKTNPHTSLHVGNIELDVYKRLVSNGSEHGIDIATLQITDEEIKDMGKFALSISLNQWPPSRAVRKERLLVCGFPAISRNSEMGELDFGAAMLSPLVESVNERQVTITLDRENWVDVIGNGFPEEGVDLGGISGGPMLRVT